MKKQMISIAKYALVITIGLSMSSCSDWLDVKPKTETEQSELFSSKSGFQRALLGIYTQMGNRELYADNLTLGFLDAVAQRYEQTQSTQRFYYAVLGNYDNAKVQDRLTDIWGTMYNSIANANNILDNIDKNKTVLDEQNYRIIKGESLALRAYMHFDLLRMFGPAYSVDASRICIPYVQHFGKDENPKRSVKDVIELALADLNEAEELLKTDPINGGEIPVGGEDFFDYRQNRLNYFAVKALKARVYLYKGDKANALKYAQEVINSTKFRFVKNSEVTTVDMARDRTFSAEHLFSLYIEKLAEPVDEYFKLNNNNTTSDLLNNTTTVIDAVFEVQKGGSTDYRYAYLWDYSNSSRVLSKFWQNDEYLRNYKYLMPLLRFSEMYYIAAEASDDPAVATTYLNLVRQNRGLKDLPQGLTIDQIQNEIFSEYKKEFFAEGQLFYYYKRTNAASMENSPTPVTPARYVFPLPPTETLK